MGTRVGIRERGVAQSLGEASRRLKGTSKTLRFLIDDEEPEVRRLASSSNSSSSTDRWESTRGAEERKLRTHSGFSKKGSGTDLAS